MTTPTKEQPVRAKELVERLRAKRRIAPALGGGTISSDGKTTTYITDDGYRYVNPDGPEAATLLERQEQAAGKLAAALQVFARCPEHGKHGGPFVIAFAQFEDMTKGSSAPREAYWHKDDFERARQALRKYHEAHHGN